MGLQLGLSLSWGLERGGLRRRRNNRCNRGSSHCLGRRSRSAVSRALRRRLMGLGSLSQVSQQNALDDASAMLVDDAHMRRCANADFAQQRDRLFARQMELFCELVYSYG